MPKLHTKLCVSETMIKIKIQRKNQIQYKFGWKVKHYTYIRMVTILDKKYKKGPIAKFMYYFLC